jgi:hypothetical protein
MLVVLLSIAVPPLIQEIERQGGINDVHLSYVSNHAHTLGSEGDTLLYKVQGKTSKMFVLLAECLAVLAFAPGGVKFAGLHFIGHPEMEANECEQVQELAQSLVIDEVEGTHA